MALGPQRPKIIFREDTEEYNLLYGPLAKPHQRADRGPAHPVPIQTPKQRLRSAFNRYLREKVEENIFPYSRLEKGEIRILRLHPGSGSASLNGDLFKRKLEEARDGYEALSYCWGGPNEKASETIMIRDLNATLNNFTTDQKSNKGLRFAMAVKASRKFQIEEPFRIRRNLYQALLRLRSRVHSVNLWIDAICIDQSSRGEKEKAEQLAMMDKIYNSAANVCIWLGEEFGAANGAIQLVREMMNLRKFDSLVASPDEKGRWSQLIHMMNAPWFSRRWIIQEVALSRNATVHCANHTLHWDDFADAVSLLTEKIDTLRAKFRDEIFDDVETTSACILVHTLTNVWRKPDDTRSFTKLLDLETLVSTLLSFQAAFARDTIYAVISLARDPPQPNEEWLGLHNSQLQQNRTPKTPVGFNLLTPNYKINTRDLFIAFVTRSIKQSGCLDIICRHWAPPITDERFGEKVLMPSWVSEMSKAPFGIPGASLGRQNGENFVAYSPEDLRRRYTVSGSSTAVIDMVDDPDLELQKPIENGRSNVDLRDIHNAPVVESPAPSPNLNSPTTVMDLIPEEPELAESPIQGQLLPDRTKPGASTVPSGVPPNVDGPPQSRPRPAKTPSRKSSTTPNVEREHELSGILSVTGFILGYVADHSDVMRGGIIPSDWVVRTGWDKDSSENQVPDTLWRLLVADRSSKGVKPPRWYKRACLHGLTHPKVADAEGNIHFHSVLPEERKISEMTAKYFNRVKEVVWNRRLIEVGLEEDLLGVKSEDENPKPLLGLAPKETEIGDWVCILHGCSVPVVLRAAEEPRVQGLFTLIGEAYVHEVMDGEAAQDPDLVKYLTREFFLE